MLTTAYWQIHKIVGEWLRRAHSRRELELLSPVERRDLPYKYDVNAEMRKWFWQS